MPGLLLHLVVEVLLSGVATLNCCRPGNKYLIKCHI